MAHLVRVKATFLLLKVESCVVNRQIQYINTGRWHHGCNISPEYYTIKLSYSTDVTAPSYCTILFLSVSATRWIDSIFCKSTTGCNVELEAVLVSLQLHAARRIYDMKNVKIGETSNVEVETAFISRRLYRNVK